MSWVDWLIVLIPVAFVLYMGLKSRTYIRSVADFLSAGRVCGRYIINVGDLANALSVIGIITIIEVYYQAGFAVSLWSGLLVPLSMIVSLTGYCTYRFRETKAMSLGQFLEMRYSRKFRIFAAFLRTLSEIIANSIMPAIAARFFIYFLDLPQYITVFGMKVSLYALIMTFCLAMAIFIICMGGTLALIITDSIQGMILYPLMVIFVIFVLVKFDWGTEMVPTLADRAPGDSFINPFDIERLKDFNVFSLMIIPILNLIFHQASWLGAGYSTAAKSPHEQKIGSMLGSWRNSIVVMMMLLFAVMIITLLNHKDFADSAHDVRTHLAHKINEEPILGLSPEMKQRLDTIVDNQKPIIHTIGVDEPLSARKNLDTQYLEPIHQELLKGDSASANLSNVDREAMGNTTFRKYRTFYYQLSLASTMRKLLPMGLMGCFFLMMVMAMISTDDTRIYSASLTFTQDCILPLLKKPLTMKQHVWVLRITSIAVGVFFLIASLFMAQLSYIQLFVTIVTSLWLGGCGPVLVFGLYSRIGTTAAAWTCLLTGAFLTVFNIFLDRGWSDIIYPFLQENNLVETVGNILEKISGPLPFIEWKINPVDCPINSYEFYFLNMIITLLLYLGVSYLTCKEPFNLDRMLHRGKYNLDGENKETEKLSFKNIFRKLLGITPEYSKGDKVIAWTLFGYSIVYQFILIVVVVLIWNHFYEWPIEWWGHYFLITKLIVPGIIAAISAVWLSIGGVKDLIDMFQALKSRVVNHLDNGTVDGRMSLADKSELEAVDKEKK